MAGDTGSDHAVMYVDWPSLGSECYKPTHHIHDPLTTHTLFEFDNNSITRSHPYKLKKPRFNSKKYQHFLTNRIVNPWNCLLADVVSAETLNAFKNKLDKHWAHRKYLYQFSN